jgi:hypothetical protein
MLVECLAPMVVLDQVEDQVVRVKGRCHHHHHNPVE